MTNDLIADMLTRIRNANALKRAEVLVQHSNTNRAILNVLKEENYISDFEDIVSEDAKKVIRVKLKYFGFNTKTSPFKTLKRVSTPGHRIYCGYKNLSKKLNPLRQNTGFAILSTSVGVISSRQAEFLKIGGEILCYIK